MAEEADEPTAAHELLAIYLQDHRAGAAAGVQLVQRCRRQASGELATMLAWLEAQIDEDRQSLESIMGGLGVSQSPLKTALSVLAERAGRFKLNGHLWKRSPLSTLLELEALAAAVYTKRNLWQSLAATEQPAAGDPRQFVELIQRATVQLERVQSHHEAAARHAFDAATTPSLREQRSTDTTARHDGTTREQTLASDLPEDVSDRLLEDAEGGIEGSLLDAPGDADGAST
jgi:hypothetical protein